MDMIHEIGQFEVSVRLELISDDAVFSHILASVLEIKLFRLQYRFLLGHLMRDDHPHNNEQNEANHVDQD